MSTTRDGSAPEERARKLSGPGKSLRVGLVARDPLRLLGLQVIVAGATLEGERSATVVALELSKILDDSKISIALIDASCTDHLFEMLANLRQRRPQMRLIVIGESSDPEVVQRVIAAGAKGYLTQTAGEDEIRMALMLVSEGSVWAPRKVLARLLDVAPKMATVSRRSAIVFTKREVEVLRSLVAGMGNREIAATLKIDEATVKAHLTRLMRKVGAKNRVELTLRALEQSFTEAADC